MIGDSSVGCLRLGASLDEVASACGGFADTVLVLEGSDQPGIWVDVGGGRALGEVVGDSIWRIRVSDPRLQTPDSIRVGTPLRRLAEYPDLQIAYGEGVFALTESHCGKSFELRGLLPRRAPWPREELLTQPDSVQVSSILIIGRCGVH